MGKGINGVRTRRVRIKVVRRNFVTGRVTVSYLKQDNVPQPSSQQTAILSRSTSEQVGSDVTRPSKPKHYTRELSPYNLFCRDVLRNKGTLKDLKGRWSTLEEDKKDEYKREAAALRAEVPHDLNAEMREHKIKKCTKQLKLEVSKLESLGVETAILTFDRQRSDMEVNEYSSKEASEFLCSTDTANKYALHFKATSSSTSHSVKGQVGDLVKQVQDLFNLRYKEAGGSGRLPYRSLNRGLTVTTSGLPNGLSLKKPSFYGRHQLQAILKDAEQISFQIIESDLTECCPTEKGEVNIEDMDTEGAQQIAQGFPETTSSRNAVAMVTADDNQDDVCCVCCIHYDDKQKNATKKWRLWSQCTACQLWSHTACGFKHNMCQHCQ